MKENKKPLVLTLCITVACLIAFTVWMYKAASDGKPYAMSRDAKTTTTAITTVITSSDEFTVKEPPVFTTVPTTTTPTTEVTITIVETTSTTEETTTVIEKEDIVDNEENPTTVEDIPAREEPVIKPLGGQENLIQNQEVFVEVLESNSSPSIPEREVYYFYEPSKRVHTAGCKYTDPSVMSKIIDGRIDTARPCTVCNPGITIDNLYVPEEESVPATPSGTLTREYVINEMTYYKGSTWTCCGARGTTLTNNYSCASNYYPFGTILYIKSADGSVDGYYEVEDRGGMSNNVVDIYYNDYSLTPYSFRQWGRVPVEVWVVS